MKYTWNNNNIVGISVTDQSGRSREMKISNGRVAMQPTLRDTLDQFTIHVQLVCDIEPNIQQLYFVTPFSFPTPCHAVYLKQTFPVYTQLYLSRLLSHFHTHTNNSGIYLCFSIFIYNQFVFPFILVLDTELPAGLCAPQFFKKLIIQTILNTFCARTIFP